MNLTIMVLTHDLEEEYFDFFDNCAFSDGSPYYPCYGIKPLNCNVLSLVEQKR